MPSNIKYKTIKQAGYKEIILNGSKKIFCDNLVRSEKKRKIKLKL